MLVRRPMRWLSLSLLVLCNDDIEVEVDTPESSL